MTYYRVRLIGHLHTLSELHIGSGEVLAQEADKTNATDEPKSEPSAVLVDTQGKPYIPASTLRGFLRSQLPPEQADILFGSGNQGKEGKGVGMIGLVRIYDARCLSDRKDNPELPIMTRTSIDPVTQTAKQHSLYGQQLVPVNTCFTVEIEIDQRLAALADQSASAVLSELDDSLIQALLDALSSFDKNATAQLGKGKSVGQGRLQWQLDTLDAITLDRLKVWAQAKDKRLLKDCYQSIQDQFATETSLTTDWQVLPFQLQAMSPLLINNPDDAEANREAVGAPKQIFLKRLGATNQAVIPASTLKGWCRAQCRRILLTLTQHAQVDRVDSLLQQLFGGTDQVGVLRFYDATVSYTDDDIHLQTFNAVDRFTGGVKEGALYSVKALYPKTAFEGQVAYQGTLKLWMKWLLLLVWRDAEEGDLVLGSDKAKGYGQLILKGFKQGTYDYFAQHQTLLQQGASELAQKLHPTTGTGAAA